MACVRKESSPRPRVEVQERDGREEAPAAPHAENAVNLDEDLRGGLRPAFTRLANAAITIACWIPQE